MKFINIKLRTLIPVACLSILSLTGCKKDWLDINTNPNTLPTPRPDYVLTSAINRNAAVLGANETGSYWAAQWTQSSTYVLSSTIFTYNFNNTNFNYWDGWYDILEDLQYAINAADKSNLPALKGPAKVMKAYIYQELVDCYGNIPFTEALKGSGTLAPKFDDQKTVYENLIKMLDEAIADVKANAFDVTSSAADIVFKGSATNWVRFANSLKLRILIRQSRISGRDAYITAEITKAAATTEGFLNPGQDVGSNPGYVAATSQTNPYYDNWGYDPNGAVRALGRYPRPTTYLFSALTSTNDTFRLKTMFWAKGGEDVDRPGFNLASKAGDAAPSDPAKLPKSDAYKDVPLDQYVAVPFGISSGYLAQNTSYIGSSVLSKGKLANPMYLMLAAESFFLLAEAKVRYPTLTLPATGTDGSAKGYYEQGVRESFRVTGTTAKYTGGTDRATILLTSGFNLADWNASPDKLKAIWQQKWLALANFGGLEAWTDNRRTGFPVLPLSASAAAGSTPPVRLYYPTTEVGSNGDNVKAQGTINVFTSRLFWDVD